jgi:hypothetical protein
MKPYLSRRLLLLSSVSLVTLSLTSCGEPTNAQIANDIKWIASGLKSLVAAITKILPHFLSQAAQKAINDMSDIANQIADIADQIYPPSNPIPGTPSAGTLERILKGVKDFVTALDDLCDAISTLTGLPIFKVAVLVLEAAGAVLNFIITAVYPTQPRPAEILATPTQPAAFQIQAYHPANLPQAELDLQNAVLQIPR